MHKYSYHNSNDLQLSIPRVTDQSSEWAELFYQKDDILTIPIAYE